MKATILTLAMGLMLYTAAVGQPKEFAWLIGTWNMEDKNTYEVWSIKPDKKTMHGISFRVKQEGDTLVTEDIVLERKGHTYYYVPDVAGDQPPVTFKITHYDHESFTAENPKHDFPKIIRYKNVKNDGEDRIEATIEGNGRSISYTFVRVR